MATDNRIKNAIEQHLHQTLFSVEKPKPDQRGKVRDIFFCDQTMIMVNTDRISAFDKVIGTIPLKGALLCEQACYWFKQTENICPHHLLDRPDEQIMVGKKATPFKVEVIVRGFLAGSLMREDKHTRGSAYGLRLDPELKAYQQLDIPIITPTTKADYGEHDEPISPEGIIARNLMSTAQWAQTCDYALNLFTACSKKALEQGLLLVDTKYEFGLIDGVIHLIDEIHTSDSSRFFMKDDYEKKFSQQETPVMLDKEFLRQYLLQHNASSLENFSLDDAMRREIAERYYILTEKITGTPFTAPTQNAHERVHQRLETLIC